ncbi:hypothetical protein CFN78_04005 [Amycolatopsis antarctica]|uniref:DUF2752 domain-containing protein n=1 Tax=Amycolatopsis antarctica TaxID=1854586 RepID=A0A263D9E2_9PSEU|nr:DUF2752 domain-containing protein [Amycolatopsis antarctica]OZM74628.1 hypothetical protein CFN78_04005 [Amycolatopsis antarctica]
MSPARASVYRGRPARGVRALARALAPPLAVTAAAGVCCAGVLLADPTTPGGPIPVCPTRAWFGLVCPGCGGMRMLYSLLHGDLAAAAHFNAVALAFLVLLLASLVTWTVGRVRGRHLRGWQHLRFAPLAAGVVLGGWLLVRNLPFPPFEALRV